MPHLNDAAIVLRRSDYAETSQILVLFLREHGKVHAIAKGVRRSTKQRFQPGIDLLESGRVVLSVRQLRQEAMATLVEWKPTRAPGGLHDRLDRLHSAVYVADVTSRLTEDWDAHPAVFDGLEASFAALAVVEQVLSVVTGYQRVVLNETGLMPRFDGCVGCGRAMPSERSVVFSSFEGGLVCRDCEPARVEKRTVRVPNEVLTGRKDARGAEIAGLFDLFHYHLSHVAGREPACGAELTRLAAEMMRAR
ncbi:MAG: DNA repair protein RecO [Phycisphaerales bacterium]|nr:DNA repair protein RecO [Phycisphaerales bacterium]